MQTSQDTIVHAGVQTPLLTADQLRVGVLLTGIAMSHIWEVLEVERTHLSLIRLPKKPLCQTHTLVSIGRGQHCITCGMRRQEIKDFLPLKPEKGRVYLITPRAPMERPEPYTVYGGITGAGAIKLYQLSAGGINLTPEPETYQWSEALPLFPILHKLWSIPARLRELSEATPNPVDHWMGVGTIDPAE